jgi:3-hydroxy-9,10-secoandrosta-1,3,5(10)-triene-9,17-dione monooxygenase
VSENAGPAVVARVSELLPMLRERAQETEDARVVPAESVKALAETGFFRLLSRPGSAGTRPTRSRSSPPSA